MLHSYRCTAKTLNGLFPLFVSELKPPYSVGVTGVSDLTDAQKIELMSLFVLRHQQIVVRYLLGLNVPTTPPPSPAFTPSAATAATVAMIDDKKKEFKRDCSIFPLTVSTNFQGSEVTIGIHSYHKKRLANIFFKLSLESKSGRKKFILFTVVMKVTFANQSRRLHALSPF